MRKHFLQSLLVVVLSVIGVSQCWADDPYYAPFTYVEHKTGAYQNSTNGTISYNNLNNTLLSSSTSKSLHGEEYGDGYQIYLPNGYNGYKSGFMMLTSYTHSIEPYTKVTLTYNYLLGCCATEGGLWAYTSLYKFDDETTAKTTALDFTDGLYNAEAGGGSYRFASVQSKAAGWKTVTGTTTFYFDNLTGANTQSISKYITLVLCEGNGGASGVGQCWFNGSFKCTSYSFAYTYRKIITFNANGGSGSMSNQNIDNSGNLTTNAFTRDGYTFIGWNTKADGTGTAYANGAAITATETDKGLVTLYAQWKRTVTIDKQDGTSTITIEVNCNSTYNTLPADPTRTGYTFKGWFDAQTGGTQYTKTTASTNDIPATIYAQWSAIVYNITYNVNGGSEITEHKTYTIETATFNLPKPTKDGYTFGGWFTNEACTEGLTTQIDQGSTGNKEFFAQWSENVVSDGSDKDNVDDAATEVNTTLNTWLEECEDGKTINLTINRTIYKDGYYNTLCLPFDMSATQITETFGAYKELKQFQSATVQGSGSSRSIVIEVEDATNIEAGKAYLISFEKGTDLTSLTFTNVVVSTVEATDESGTLAYQGILAPYQLPYNNQDYLFLGENNTLYWAINDGTFMKGFRAYFKVNTNPAQAPYRVGMRAAFGGRQTPTDLSPVVGRQEVRKLLKRGRVVIVNKGVKYNMNGATVQ